MSIRIILADDHELLREGLRMLIEEQPDMTVIAEADDGRVTVQLVEKLMPDIVVTPAAARRSPGDTEPRSGLRCHPGGRPGGLPHNPHVGILHAGYPHQAVPHIL